MGHGRADCLRATPAPPGEKSHQRKTVRFRGKARKNRPKAGGAKETECRHAETLQSVGCQRNGCGERHANWPQARSGMEPLRTGPQAIYPGTESAASSCFERSAAQRTRISTAHGSLCPTICECPCVQRRPKGRFAKGTAASQNDGGPKAKRSNANEENSTGAESA